MLNIEKYKEELKKCKRIRLDCQICKMREECKEVESGFCFSNPCSACREDNIEWLCSEYKEPILTEEEKAYLSAVIKPFRKKVKYIAIWGAWNGSKQFVHIELSDMDYANLPNFETNTMYKGMKGGKKYTLEELGI